MNYVSPPKKLLAVLALLLLIFSCKEDETYTEYGKIKFSVSPSEINAGRTKEAGTPAAILISIKDSNGTTVYDRKKLNLFQFNTEFLSEPLSLKTGNYTLVEFLVLDEDNKVIYATPLEGSALAYLVDDPLPKSISINKDQTATQVPQVLGVDSHRPSDFGYTTFSFNPVKTFNFLLGVFAYDETTKNFELTNSTIVISTNGTTVLEKNLPDLTNDLVLKDDLSTYKIEISKEGYSTYTKSFSVEELKVYNTDSVLTVILFKQTTMEGLVGEYLFNGNTDDTSGKNHDGNPVGVTLTTDRKGNPNAAYSFNGQNSDYIVIENNDDMNFGADQDFSISLWAWIDASQVPDGGINDILRKWNGDAQGYPFCVAFINEFAANSQEKIGYVRYDGQACGNVATSYSPVVTRNTFHHIVLTKQGSTLRQYLDNVLVEEFTDPTVCSTGNTANITIGCRGQLVRFFTGKIDDIRIFNRQLSTDEIDMFFKE